MDGLGYSYAWFAQDDWKLTPQTDPQPGLALRTASANRGAARQHRVFPAGLRRRGHRWLNRPWRRGGSRTQAALAFTSSDFAAAIAPTPIMTAAQAGIPSGLHFTDHTDWGPRLGFAWRPFQNDKTVFRGGWGRFIETPLGFSLVAGWAVHASYVGTYNQDFAIGRRYSAALVLQSVQHRPRAAPPEPPASITPFPSTTRTHPCSSGT